MRLIYLYNLVVLSVFLSGCDKDLLAEFPKDPQGELVEVEEIRLVTYNIHGGNGPNGEESLQDNLSAFKAMLSNEIILCFQEVEPED